MNHNEIRHMLSEYIDGAVSPEDRTAIEEHLKTCERCSDALKELRQTVAVIRTVEELDPPAWMTQKIMAKVRVEAAKKSWFHRFFFPLHIKLPLEAVGVLFLAVTAVFIYQNIQPSMRTPNPLVEEYAPAQEPLPSGIEKKAEQKSTQLSRRAKKLPQAPGYKALDMKQAYEPPAPPALQDQTAAPAPAFSKPAKQPAVAPAEKKETSSASAENDRSVVSREETNRGNMMMLRATTATGAPPEAAAKAKSAVPAAPIAGAAVADKAMPAIIVQVTDREAAAKEVEKAITQMNGSIVRRETTGSKNVFFATIKAERAGELKNKLKLLGEIKEQAGEWGALKEQMELRIEVIQK
ncbi:MAG: hypothetical protein A2X58_11485 [Nitrospirae bacterium GWC2_56_14]|nr:MAG: hypothetical protein A2X58_11485 [Nitrospirae bacterium GWC2_56_14]